MDHSRGYGLLSASMHHLTGCTINELKILDVLIRNLLTVQSTQSGQLSLTLEWTKCLWVRQKQVRKAIEGLERRGLISVYDKYVALDTERLFVLAKTHREELLRCICEIERSVLADEKNGEMGSVKSPSLWKILEAKGILPSPLQQVCQIRTAVERFASYEFEGLDCDEAPVLQAELDATIARLVSIRGRLQPATTPAPGPLPPGTRTQPPPPPSA